MPGLAEMHGHIPPPTAPRELVDNVLFLYVAAGVTTVRGMQGAPGQLDLREAAKRGDDRRAEPLSRRARSSAATRSSRPRMPPRASASRSQKAGIC